MKRLKRKPKPEKMEKPKPAYDPNLGSGYTPGQDGGSWLLPDSAREPLEDIGVGRRHWVPKRRN